MESSYGDDLAAAEEALWEAAVAAHTASVRLAALTDRDLPVGIESVAAMADVLAVACRRMAERRRVGR